MRRCLATWSIGLAIACTEEPRESASVSPLSAGPVTTYVGEQDMQFAFRVASGDIDGDDVTDAIAVSPMDDWGPVDCLGGLHAFVGPVHGSVNSWEAPWQALCPSQASGPFDFGAALAVGDVNGDGLAEIVVGAPSATNTSSAQVGAIYVFAGANRSSSSGPLSVYQAIMGTALAGRFGAAVAIGDVDDDGRNDVIVGAPNEGAGVIRVYRSLGSAWLDPTPTSVSAGVSGDQLGAALVAADFNGDGKADVLAGAPGASAQKGTATVFAGGSTGITNTVLWSTTGKAPSGRFGATVAAANLGGDARPDVIVSAPSAQSGSVHVFVNGASGIPTTDTTSVSRGGNGAQFGASLAAGDTDGDSRLDLVVGAPLAGGTGAVHVYAGTPSGLATNPYATRTGAANSQLGTSVAADDFDGDGLADVLVSAPGVDEAYLYGGADCWLQKFYVDADGDGWGLASTAIFACANAPPAGRVATSGDCLDSNSAAYPGAEEIPGDSIDEDCDSHEMCLADYDDDGSVFEWGTIFSLDTDCADPYEGVIGDPIDCNDMNPGTPIEVCDAQNIDEDCDGVADDADASATGKLTFYVDGDGDGYGSATQVLRCDAPAGYAAVSGDCDDANASRSPGAAEVTGDGIDANCDGSELCFADSDGDGYRPNATSTIASNDVDCADAGEATATAPTTDCDDAAATTHPGATEVPADDIDSNCDATEMCFVDVDGDGYRPNATSTIASNDLDCADAGEATASAPTTDCDDSAATTHPGASESCNGIDDDCDGVIDPIAFCPMADPPMDDPPMDDPPPKSGGGCATSGDAGGCLLLIVAGVLRRRRRYSSRNV